MREEGWVAIPNKSAQGRKTPLAFLGPARKGRIEWLPNFVKSVNSLTPVVSAIMTIKASAQKQSTLKEKRVPLGTAAVL